MWMGETIADGALQKSKFGFHCGASSSVIWKMRGRKEERGSKGKGS